MAAGSRTAGRPRRCAGAGACGRLLRACAVLAVLAAADPTSAGRAARTAKLLQGPLGKAALAAVVGRGAAARREDALQAEVDVMRDVVAVSQALEGELPLGGGKVPVQVYTAAGDLECRDFFHEVLARVLQKEGMFDIVDLQLVLWGSGDVVGDDGASMDAAGIAGLSDASGVEFVCAGDPSCEGNAWEACLASAYPDLTESFPVLNCIDGRACAGDEQAPAQCFGPVAEVAPVCVREFGEGIVDADTLAACAAGDEGKALLLANAQATSALDPAPGFLPWVLVDGKPVGEGGKEALSLLGKEICNAYAARGGVVPYSCTQFPQTLDEVPRDPTTDDFVSVPSVWSADSAQTSGVGTGTMMLLATLSFALLFAYCFCEPRAEDESIFDAIGGRPLSRAGYTTAAAQSEEDV